MDNTDDSNKEKEEFSIDECLHELERMDIERTIDKEEQVELLKKE